VPVPAEKSGQDLFQPIVGRGSAYADIDGDGDLDVVIAQINGPPMLLRNELAPRPNWLRIKLVGTKSNRDAIGAWVKLRAGGRTLWRQVMPTRGYLSQSELPLTFGLGKATRVDELTVQWPDGTSQRVDPPALNRLVTITEPRHVDLFVHFHAETAAGAAEVAFGAGACLEPQVEETPAVEQRQPAAQGTEDAAPRTINHDGSADERDQDRRLQPAHQPTVARHKPWTE
jgi:hypothetical protein